MAVSSSFRCFLELPFRSQAGGGEEEEKEEEEEEEEEEEGAKKSGERMKMGGMEEGGSGRPREAQGGPGRKAG